MPAFLVSLVLLALCIAALYYFYQGPIYVPSHKSAVLDMLKLAQPTPGQKVADLGSGDGRIVAAFAQAGCDVVGFEINPVLAMFARRKLAQLGISQQAKIVRTNFWSRDFSEFDIVVVFGIKHIMSKLSQKLKRELKPGSLVVSNAFSLPGLQVVAKQGSVLLYKI